jgi:hypothetical protein
VVQQLQEGVEKDTAQEMMQALSGGIKQAGQMSAQAQGQPMSGGIAAAPGANQAAQPEAMASGGIVAFKKGGTEGEEEEDDAYTKASKKSLFGTLPGDVGAGVLDLLTMPGKIGWDWDRYNKTGELVRRSETEGLMPRLSSNLASREAGEIATAPADKPAAINQDRPLPPTKGQNAADYEDMRPQGGIATTLPRPPAQRPPVAAINQAPRPPASAPNLNIQTNPNYAPPAAAGDAGGLSGLMAEQIKNRLGAKPEDAETAALEKYNKAMAVDPEMAAQLKADNARVRATAERKGAAPTWQESLYAAMPKGRPQPGSSIFTTIGDAVGGINALELQRKGEKEVAEK